MTPASVPVFAAGAALAETTQRSEVVRARSVMIKIRTDIAEFNELPVFAGVLIA
ncbi:hypothetical protein [Streptomyces sp. NPDC045251]|uniref:hypothetical protein n=1 Tax=unclassified Streptomyces TaxID=2593676 RepID=UPI0033CBDAC4